MTQKDKDILIAKIETLRWSFSDTQLQAIMSVLHDVVASIETADKGTMGFSSDNKK